jgi:processive 1,2-diacylglycerol beta-glucosyltransferase
MTKKVLLLSEGFGSGHTRTAQALAAALEKHSPDICTNVIELGAYLRPTLSRIVLNTYRKILRSHPKLYVILYRHQYKKMLGRFAQMALHRLLYTEIETMVREFAPDVIVSTHPFPSAVISRLKRTGLAVPLCTVVTDYDMHGAWITAETDTYLVSTPAIKEKLLQHRICEKNISVTGIPIHPNFLEKQNSQQIRSRFQLKDMPTVLIMGGGWGLIRYEELLRRAVKWKEQIQFIVCLGDNEKVLRQLQADELFRHPNIRLLAYTGEIHNLMEVSDLLITKPGAVTCTEALFKGLPMLFYEPIPGHEEKNCRYFIHNGYGESLSSLESVEEWMQRIVDHYPHFVQKRAHLDQGFSQQQPRKCSEAIIRLLHLQPSV